ncbi:MAG: sulfotransferase [Parvularculaceae bacterium]
MPRSQNIVFIGGAPRSGTTLLRAIVGTGANIACGPELRVIPALCTLAANISATSAAALTAGFGVDALRVDQMTAGAIQQFLTPLQQRAGASRVAEKTPANALHFPALRRMFPDAPIVSIVRDGRDVVSSLLRMDWRDDRTGAPMPATKSARAGAELWAASVAADERMRGDKHFYSLRYENLVADPAREISALYEFLEEPTPNLALFHQHAFDPLEGENEASAARVAEPIDTASVGRWRRDLSPAQLDDIEAAAGPWLRRYGYV